VKRILIYTDGAARGNPGPAGAGAVLIGEDGSVLAEVSRYLGKTTNNQAEYQALVLALEEAKKLAADEVNIFSDSELLVKQIKGEYHVKNDGLKPLFKLVKSKLQHFGKYKIEYLPRERNAHADRLANRAIDEYDH
jgi:ribonuclease HI